METTTLHESVKVLKTSAKQLSFSTETERNSLLLAIAEGLVRDYPQILAANEQDCREAENAGEATAMVKRLVFSQEKLTAVVLGLKQVAALPDPVGSVLQRRLLDEHLLLEQVRVPIGVIGMIFEARPDALVQIVSLCLKSGNGIILKGGHEAFRTNSALVASIKESCRESVLGDQWLLLLESRADVDQMLGMEGQIDLLIPRGSNAFVRYVMEHTSIPVLGHADGICHVYIDEHADLEKAVEIVFDSKTQYPAACNAVETVLVHRSIAPVLIPMLGQRLSSASVLIHGDLEVARHIACVPFHTGDWETEYLALELNIHVVDTILEAVQHIETYGSHHTDAIVSESPEAIRFFYTQVDSADVFANCSTRFADGYRYGLGAEVGISTAKIHARGPVGLEGLMTSKYLLKGNGEVVASYTGKDARPFLHQDLACDTPSELLGDMQ